MQEGLKKIGINETLENHMEMLLCSTVTEQCQLLNCENCPPLSSLEDHISEVIQATGVKEVSFLHWTSVDRPDILTRTEPTDTFCELYASTVNQLISHDYVTKAQSKYFYESRTNVAEGEAVVTMDFSQNFTHFSQAAIQSDYYGSTQTTIHPVVVYYRKFDGTIEHKSLVFVSPIIDHNTVFVRIVVQKLVVYLKKLIPNLKKIKYFSDGAGSQYKNKFNFEYVARHSYDFGINATWSFFSTSHGKGPHDGIGAVVKRWLSLQILRNKIIRSAQAAFDALKCAFDEKLISVEPFFISKDEFAKVRASKTAETVPGTRNFHHVSCAKSIDDGQYLRATLEFRTTSSSVAATEIEYEIKLKQEPDEQKRPKRKSNPI